jgi:hypothetical protein
MNASPAHAGALPAGAGAKCWYTPSLWHAMSLTAWLRLLRAHGFRMQRARWLDVSAVTLSCAGNSLLGLLQQVLQGAKLRDTAMRPDPIFVLGHWRSGTTCLHELLALDERFGFPTSLECFAPHHCLLTSRLHPALLSRWLPRPPSGPDRPLEDELALVALGAPSPLWSLAYPGESRGQRYLSLRDVSPGERERWSQILMHFVRLVSCRYPGKRLVLKSPSHTARLGLLSRLFPRARFLHIVRDPYVVFSSTVELWRRTHAESALLPPARFDLESHVMRTLQDMYADFDSARAALPPGRFHQVYYEQLARDPVGTLAQCYQAIGLGDFEQVRPQVARYVTGLVGQGTIDEPISAQNKAAVAAAWGPIFRPWGYEI